jgi:hypothetical protein
VKGAIFKPLHEAVLALLQILKKLFAQETEKLPKHGREVAFVSNLY